MPSAWSWVDSVAMAAMLVPAGVPVKCTLRQAVRDGSRDVPKWLVRGIFTGSVLKNFIVDSHLEQLGGAPAGCTGVFREKSLVQTCWYILRSAGTEDWYIIYIGNVDWMSIPGSATGTASYPVGRTSK